MQIVYYTFIFCSVTLCLYTSINTLLVTKFISSLPTITKEKYKPVSRISIIMLLISLGLLGVGFIVHHILFKTLISMITIFLNLFNISEASVIKKYV